MSGPLRIQCITPPPVVAGTDGTLWGGLGRWGVKIDLSFRDCNFEWAVVGVPCRCDAYNDAAASRPYPNCYELHCFNPKHLETSVSV